MFLSLSAPSNSLPKIFLTANLQLPSPFSSEVINTWHFLARRRTLWCHRWYLVFKMLLVWVHHRIPRLKICFKVNLQLPSPFSSEVINTWHFLGHRGTLWRHRWYLVLKCFLVWVHHRIPHFKISRKVNLQLPSPFSSKLLTLGTFWASGDHCECHRWYLALFEMFLSLSAPSEFPTSKLVVNANFQFPNTFSSKVINTCHFLGLRGTLWRHRWYLVLKCFLVWVHHGIPHAKISLKVNLQLPSPFSSKVINTWHFLGLRGTLWRHRWYLVLCFFVRVHHRPPFFSPATS